jgi:hypothetical protein
LVLTALRFVLAMGQAYLEQKWRKQVLLALVIAGSVDNVSVDGMIAKAYDRVNIATAAVRYFMEVNGAHYSLCPLQLASLLSRTLEDHNVLPGSR